MRIRQFCVGLGVVFLANALPVFADPITVVFSDRSLLMDAAVGSVRSFGESMRNQDAMSTATGVFAAQGSATVAGSLFSQVLGNPIFNGHGDTAASHSSTSVPSAGHSQANYFARFDVAVAQQYSFLANFTTTGNDAGNRSSWRAELLSSPDTALPQSTFLFEGNDT